MKRILLDDLTRERNEFSERAAKDVRRHSTLGYLSPMEFEMNAQLA